MRTIGTLLLSSCSLFANGQVEFDTLSMFFDVPGESLQLDSVYPAGCWQVGTPTKPIFTGALSMPRALVTDTLLPYPDSTTCYAEFTTVSTLFNAQRTIAFKYFLDTDSLASLGWIETFEWWTGLWRPIDGALDIEFTASHVTPTDSTPVFTGRSLGWDSLSFSFGCNKQGVPDTVRFRFAFRSTSNPSLRDGWMIDNVMHTSFNCMGSVGENEFLATKVVPNPTSDEVNIYIALPVSAQYKMQLFRGDGALILEVERNYSGSQILDLTSLPNGPYLLQIIAEGKHATERIILQH